jgi:hypothetical protein
MTLRQIRIGSLVNIGQYEDGDYDSAIETSEPMQAGPPTLGPHVIRLSDLSTIVLQPVVVVDIHNPVELNTLAGTNGVFVIAYEAAGPALANKYTIYAYDSNGPVVNPPFIIDAPGVGNERWIAVAGTYTIFGSLIPPGVNTGDIVRYNAISGNWETVTEPFEFKGLVLTPMLAAAAADIEGFMYYNSAEKAVKVCTDI